MIDRRMFLGALTAAGLLTLTMNGFSAPPDKTPAGAQIRIIHASPDAPAVDILLDDKKTLENVPFKKVSEYMSVAAGMHTLKVVVTGSNNAVIETPITLKPGIAYTALAIGKASDSSIKPLILEDVTPTTPKGKARVRLVYAIPDGSPVDLVIPGDATKKGSPKYLAKNLAMGTATDYLTLPAGSYTLEVRSAGMSSVVKKIEVTVKSGTAYSVVAFGLVSDSANIDMQPLTDTTVSAKTANKNAKKADKPEDQTFKKFGRPTDSTPVPPRL